jgi:hypothetical protein
VRAGDALGLSKADRLKLRDVGQGEFYAFGPAFGQPGVLHFRSDKVRTTHPRPGQRHLLTAPAPSRAIRGVLGKFADLPHEAEEEIRSLDEARRRIAEMERQIKSVNGASGVQRIDQTTVNRTITAAVDRERVEWLRKMEQGRERFRRLVAALASTGQSLAKVKELLEETEREWLAPQTVATAPDPPLSQRPERIGKPAPDRDALIEDSNGVLKIAAGERRILTALAQYPEGRNKVQVQF